MRISHELARKLADILTVKSKEAINKLRTEIDVQAIAEYQLQIPEEIRKVTASCPSWIEKTDSLYVNYEVGGNKTYHIACAAKAVIIKKGRYANLNVNSKSSLRRKILKLKDAESNYRALKNETARALISMATSKKIIEQFPETAAFFKDQPKYIPLPVQKANLSGLKAKLQKQ